MRSMQIWALACVGVLGCAQSGGDAASEDDGSAVVGEPATDALSVEFDAEPQAWSTLNAGQASLRFGDGQMVVEPTQSLWFNETTGPFFYRGIDGDFIATADVTVRGIAESERPPPSMVRLGGLMARNPSSTNGQNYVFIVLGADVDDVAVETKTTVNSTSTFEGPPWPSADGEIRICRVGARFEMLVRERGGQWQSQAVYDRADLPSTLQVGAVAYAKDAPPDLRVTYDYIRFAPVSSAAACSQ